MDTWSRFGGKYLWFLLKNVLGWILIIGAVITGPLPGPNGLPMFLVGFALITFPGKRRLTSRVLRGRRVGLRSWRYYVLGALASISISGLGVLFLEQSARVGHLVRGLKSGLGAEVAFGVLTLLGMSVVIILPFLVNGLLMAMPRIRRHVRPALRKMGIHLLPPRWYRHPDESIAPASLARRVRQGEEAIVLFREEWKLFMHGYWKKIKPWLPRIVGLIVVPLIFYRLLSPIIGHWTDVAPHLHKINFWIFAIACLMFTLNQYAVRITSWRGVLSGLGWHMPQRPAARVWTASELARFVPGAIWQVVGRAYLAKPYGLPMTACSISQLLELAIFLLANVIIAASTLWFVSGQISDERARLALRFATGLVPLLLICLSPGIFYPTVNWVMRKLGKPLIDRPLSGPRLGGLLLLSIAGQAWLGLAIWLVTRDVLQLRFSDVWMITGAYCLAWTAGFCMGSIAPGGVGVREIVLGGTLGLLVGSRLGHDLDPAACKAIFAAVALLLRLWATIGELVFAVVAYCMDFSGARGKVSIMASRI